MLTIIAPKIGEKVGNLKKSVYFYRKVRTIFCTSTVAELERDMCQDEGGLFTPFWSRACTIICICLSGQYPLTHELLRSTRNNTVGLQ